MPIKHMESLQPAMAELERAVAWAAREVDDIPFHVVPVIQTRGRKSKCAGWFSVDQWSTREGENVHEITFCAEQLDQDPVDIVGIAIHEVVHLWCHFMKVKDVSTGGRHNKEFKEHAEISGLEVHKPYDSYGYGYTTVGDDLRKRIEKEFKPDVAAFNLFRLVKPSTTKPVKTNAWICECDKLTLRIPAQQTLDATCNKCKTKFVPKEAPVTLPPPPAPKKVKKHKHVDGLPEHEENVPMHEHKAGQGHEIPEPVDPEREEMLVAQEEPVEINEPVEPTPEMLESMEKFGHAHSEFYPFHFHPEDSSESQDNGDPERQHGYTGDDYDATLPHDEDAGIGGAIPEAPAEEPVAEAPKTKAPAKKKAKKAAKKPAKK